MYTEKALKSATRIIQQIAVMNLKQEKTDFLFVNADIQYLLLMMLHMQFIILVIHHQQ